MKVCGSCGSRDIAVKNQKGKSFPWKDYSSVTLLADVDLTECGNCGERMIRGDQAIKIDEAIEKTITMNVVRFIDIILKKEGCLQSELATRLGLTKEYLSEIKSGRKIPKFQTYNFIKTLAVAKDAFEVASPKFEAA